MCCMSLCINHIASFVVCTSETAGLDLYARSVADQTMNTMQPVTPDCDMKGRPHAAISAGLEGFSAGHMNLKNS